MQSVTFGNRFGGSMSCKLAEQNQF